MIIEIEMKNLSVVSVLSKCAFKHYQNCQDRNYLGRLLMFPPSGFTCHDHGATVLQYAPKQQLLISGGRKGYVCIFDIRQRQLIHTFQAHDSAIKALALDPCEEYFTTGSAEGNIKVSQYRRWHVLSVICTCCCQDWGAAAPLQSLK